MSVSRNFGPLDKLQLTTKAIMRDVGLLARERVVRRTRDGKGTENEPLAPYSPAYAAKKQAELYDLSVGKGARGAFQAVRASGGGKVNLTVSGAMLNDITITRLIEDEVDLGFSK